MRLEQARKLRNGQQVHVPADRGQPGYVGIVDQDDCRTALEHRASNGARFIWVKVKGARHSSIWPSNRLGY